MTGQQKIILIVDDDPRNRKLLDTLVQAEGHATLIAENGRDSLAQIETTLPDLILLDLMMPGMDGFDVVRQLKAHPRAHSVPIVMVTAVDDPGSRARLESAGVAEFLTKPIDRWRLQACLQGLLDHG